MNKLNLVGKLIKDVDVKTSKDGKVIARFTVAAQRKYKNSEGKYDSDFIPCVAFEKSAEFIEKYFKKGDWIAIVGHMQSGSYEGKNGKVYTLDCYVDDAEFCGGKSQDGSSKKAAAKTESSGEFMNIADGDDDLLPFN